MDGLDPRRGLPATEETAAFNAAYVPARGPKAATPASATA